MRIGAAGAARAAVVCGCLVLAALTSACSGDGLFRQYEYEEEMYLGLDGSATLYVNTSVAALDALRGASFDASPNAGVDRDAVRAFFNTPAARVNGSIKTSRRSNRRFVHVRLDVADVRHLNEAAPFAWSTYQFGKDGDLLAYHQMIGAAAGKPVTTNWTGRELVAFRMHLPSRIEFHNGGPTNPRRGNILAWEQSLADRLKGVPLELEAKVQTQSILYRTLWLFAVTGLAVALMFVVVVWLIVRRGKKANA